MARADLYLLGVGIEAGAPVDDPVAARVDRGRVRPAAARDEIAAEELAALAFGARRENMPGTPSDARIATERTIRSTGAETAN